MPNSVDPNWIPLRSIGDKTLSAAETNSLILSARRQPQSTQFIEDSILQRIRRMESIKITPEEAIDPYSIFTLQTGVTFEQGIPSAKSDKITHLTRKLVYVTNEHVPLYSTGKAYCSFINDYKAFLLSYDYVDGDPAVNTEVGPKPGTYKISKKYDGLLTVSAPNTTDHLIWCIRTPGPDYLPGKLNAQLEYNSSAAFSIWYWTGAAWADTMEDDTCYDWLLHDASQNIASGLKIWVARHNNIWVVVEAECP